MGDLFVNRLGGSGHIWWQIAPESLRGGGREVIEQSEHQQKIVYFNIFHPEGIRMKTYYYYLKQLFSEGRTYTLR